MARRTRQSFMPAAIDRGLANWMRRSDLVAQAEALPLRHDMVTLLTYLRDNRVTGTQSTGNLPLRAVREVTARFVHPPKLEHVIGEHVFKIRSEDDVWPLSFLHNLAYIAGLLDGGPARRWRLTSTGEQFLTAHPLLQVWLMCTTWWEQANWLIAFPYEGMGNNLPPRFKKATLSRLLALPVNTPVPFEPFADELIQETGLKWTAPDMSFARMSLHAAVERMVIRIMADFGIVVMEHTEKRIGNSTFQDLAAFLVTPFGRGLLESIGA